MKRSNSPSHRYMLMKWVSGGQREEALRLAALFCIVTALFATAAHAQTDADFSAYCRENFPGSIYQAIPQNWGIEHACNQGGTRQGIDFSKACRMTTGSPDHRVDGARVICSGSGVDSAALVERFAGPLDLVAFCRDEFPNSVYEKRYEPRGVEHCCRQPGATGGFTLQNVDLAAACKAQRNVTDFQKVGAQVMCLRAGGGDLAAGDGAGGKGAGGGGGGGGGNFPPLKPEDIIDAEGTGELFDKAVKYANLQGCGNADPEFRMKLPPASMRTGRAGEIYDRLGMTMPCPGMTGGRVVTFQDACNAGSAKLMEVRLLRSGLPVCWEVGREDPRQLENVLSNISLTGICQKAYFGDMPYEELKQKKVATILKYSIEDLHAECFYITIKILSQLLKNKDKPNEIAGSDKSDELNAEKGQDLFTGGKGEDSFHFMVREDDANTLDDGDRISDYEYGEPIVLEGVRLNGKNIKIVFDKGNNKTRIELDLPDWLGNTDGVADKTIILDGDKRGKLQIDPNCCSVPTTELKITEQKAESRKQKAD